MSSSSDIGVWAPTRLCLALFYLAATIAWADEPPSPQISRLTIEDAIDAAKRCVLERKVYLAGSFIEAARYERNPSGDRRPHWTVTWAYSREVKGGRVWVAVYDSGECEVMVGE